MSAPGESPRPTGDGSPGLTRTVLVAISKTVGWLALGLGIPLILVLILAFVAQLIISGR